MNYLRLIAFSLLLASSANYAAPTVTDNTISWPDDGWYQVQVVTDDAIKEVCAGTRSCEVSPGLYIVINHTTGERFEDIVVGADTAPIYAKTSNPVDVTLSGGFIPNPGVSLTTQLFIDRDDDGEIHKFWVRVDNNPGYQTLPTTATDTATIVRPLPRTIFIKHFPLSRYSAIYKSLMDIRILGVVNPYADGAIICDAQNATIRFGGNEVILAYNCGADAPSADSATLRSIELLNELRKETMNDPDLQGPVDD